MTTTKDYIRQSAWFTSNGLPDPRMETPGTEHTLNFEQYVDWWRRVSENLGLTRKYKEFFNR